MEYIVAASTDIGTARKSNQDAVCIKKAQTEKGKVVMAVVCDGMGGLSRGEVASASIVYGLNDWFEQKLPQELSKGSIEEISKSLLQVVVQMHEALFELGKKQMQSLGTTISCLLLIEQEYVIIHAGDSRIYQMRKYLTQLTTDHTVTAREVAAGRMTEEEAKHSPDRSKLTQCIGVGKKCELEIKYGRAKKGDMYLLCSDGLHHHITIEEMTSLLTGKDMDSEKTMQELCKKMIHLVMQRGEKDNISVVLLKCESKIVLENGYVLDNKYEILRRIAEGGTSMVYLAMNLKLNQQWVIKQIEGNKNSFETKRVLREARMMMKFDHSAIPRVTDILEQNNVTYIIMDYVSGQPLARQLKALKRIPQKTALEWGKQICDVLCYLHSQNPPVIYHDLKPGNIILKEPEHNIKLIDFGEARYLIDGNAPGGGKTKEYAAPEQQSQTRGKTDMRTDIYCFGTTMYRLLTGKFPPMLPEPVGSIRKRYPELQTSVSKGMDNIIRKCTNIDPEQRFQTAEELMQALDNIDWWDEDYRRRQNRKIKLFAGAIGMSAFMLCIGIGGRLMTNYTNSQTYEEMLKATGEGKIERYLEAIEINGMDTRAYIKLLDAYKESGSFSDAESRQLATVYNANLAGTEQLSIEMQELNFKIGRMYFMRYTGEQNSFRARILKAKDYFEKVTNPEFENYKMARSYYTFCTFFTKYVLNDAGGLEPELTDYEEMLTSLTDCLEDMQSYTPDLGENDAVRIRLTLYQRIQDMINTNIRGFAASGVEQQKLLETIETVKTYIAAEAATGENMDMQNILLSYCNDILDNIDREYSNLNRRN